MTDHQAEPPAGQAAGQVAGHPAGYVAGHPAVEAMATVVEGLRKVAALTSAGEVWTATSTDLVDLLRLQARAESALAAAHFATVRESDVRGLAAEQGQCSTPRWLAHLLRLHPGEAKSRVRTADMLARKATATATALLDGKLNVDQAHALAAALETIEKIPTASATHLSDAEAFLLQESAGLHAGELARLGRHIVAVLDPDGKPDGDKPWRTRELSITDLGGGRHRLKGTLTDECAALLKAAIDPLAAPRPAVKGPDGEPGEKDPRTAAQRNHDALAELCSQFLRWGELPTSRGVRPHLNVTVSVETLKGDPGHPFARTATGEDLDIATIRRLACDAGITPIVASTLGEPLAVGRESRTVTPAQWKALVARDIGCIGEGCTRPASWCEAHHFPPWEHGGRTDIDKVALVCTHEHYLVHHGGWSIRMSEDGHPEMIPPTWVDPDQRPRRNAQWKLVRDGLKTRPPDHAQPEGGEPAAGEPDRPP